MSVATASYIDRAPLAPIAVGSRTFDATYRVRIDDVDPAMTARLAGIARYLQDIALDMTEQSNFGLSNPFWIVRRNVIDVLEPITWPGNVRVRRWCSATSAMWVSMRQTLTGDPESGPFNPEVRPRGRVETESFCINVTREGRPARIDEDVLSVWSRGVSDRRLRWRVMNPTDVPDHADKKFYLLRPSDFDMFHHMNNATYWHAVDRYLAQWPEVVAGPYRAVIEYLNAVPVTEELTIRAARVDSGFGLWFHHGDTLTTTVTLTSLDE